MELLAYAACLLACGLQFALGVGITLALRKRLPRASYFIGFLVPVSIPAFLWVLYTGTVRFRPCAAENQLSCGEADAYTFLVLAGILLFNLVISAVVQITLWLVHRQQRLANARG